MDRDDESTRNERRVRQVRGYPYTVLTPALLEKVVRREAGWLVRMTGSRTIRAGREEVELTPRWWLRLLFRGDWAFRRARKRLAPIVDEMKPIHCLIIFRGPRTETILDRSNGRTL
jgi:hypothetical protein